MPVMALPYILIAPNGARHSKSDHPQLPITIDEIVATATQCHKNGADGLHLHVRDNDGIHSLDSGRYKESLSALADHVPNMRVQITTESAGVFDVQAQLACLEETRPDWASVSVREIARAPELAEKLYAGCAESGTEIQHILYDADDVALLKDWQRKDIVKASQNAVIFVLGRYTDGQQSKPADLTPFLEAMPDEKDWMVCAFGEREHACLAAVAALGGAVRVGFENSLSDEAGQVYENNAESVAKLVAILKRDKT